ncbi:GNAT family N-acetyltransferase [Bacillus sp. FJAT-49732]|uniref:GNAT family N-acetyltransferase n=1 Tax=Lederbergia citrisecunda TaxID=2833583 RepID=A0A942TMI1_9BACI|nr:GNAT family N-acetyltransferase [Lederbergia citrisecunda]MBS4201011.1 GNAT family N-acetyltransferase [Lederbergia citrisecunda]
MKTLTLKPIDRTNWELACQLNVKEDQHSFIASNLYSIAEAQFYHDRYVKGIYLNDKMVGFAMYGIDEDDGNYWIYRLMIDQAFQSKGLGIQAIQLVIGEIKQINSKGIPVIIIGYNPENRAAKRVYQKAGFIETEIAQWGEQLATYSLL